MRLGEEEIERALLEFLAKEGCWGGRYFPVDTLVNWFGKKARMDGKRDRKATKALARDRFVLLHKKGETISLNPKLSREIKDYIEKR